MEKKDKSENIKKIGKNEKSVKLKIVRKGKIGKIAKLEKLEENEKSGKLFHKRHLTIFCFSFVFGANSFKIKWKLNDTHKSMQISQGKNRGSLW